MPKYEMRTYKKSSSKLSTFQLIDIFPFEAASDEEAVAKAPNIEVSNFDNSDVAVLYDERATKLWWIKS